MKILIYGINFAPELTGIGKYTGELAESLVQQGHSVRVVTAPPYYPEWQVGPGYSAGRYLREIWQGVEILRCPLYIPRRVTGVQRLAHLSSFVATSFPRLLSQASWYPDLIFAVAPSIFGAPSALLAGRIFRSKTWLHIQDFELDAAFRLGIIRGSEVLRRSAAGVERFILRGFDRVSTISHRMVERLQHKGVASEKAVLFPNWVDTDCIYPMKEPSGFRRKLGIDRSKTVVLYSGNLGRKQGIEILVDAARDLAGSPNIQFVVCGSGTAKSELLHKAAGLENITFLPLQTLERLNDLLNMADIHILPQRAGVADFVMPSKLSGMLASGRPVIATARPGTELFQVVNAVGAAVDPENVREITTAILALASDPVKRVQMGAAGRKYVEQHWSRAQVIDTFTTIVEQLVWPGREADGKQKPA